MDDKGNYSLKGQQTLSPGQRPGKKDMKGYALKGQKHSVSLTNGCIFCNSSTL